MRCCLVMSVEDYTPRRKQCKMSSSSKKLACKGTLRQVFICLRSRTPSSTPPPPYTLYLCKQYSYSHREGGWGERVEPERRLEGQQFTKLGRKIPTWLTVYIQSINSDKRLPQSPFTSQFFGLRHFPFVSKLLISTWLCLIICYTYVLKFSRRRGSFRFMKSVCVLIFL